MEISAPLYAPNAPGRKPAVLLVDLHAAVIPGFALHWHLNDPVKTVAPRSVLCTAPTDWMGLVAPHLEGFRYHTFGEPDDPFWYELMQ